MKRFARIRESAPAITRVGTIALVALPLLAGLPGCSRPVPETLADRPLPVEVQIARPETLADHLLLTGVLEAYRAVDLVAEVTGPLEALHRDVGDAVAAGEILATIDKAIPRENLRSAEAGRMAAEARYAVAREENVRDSTLFANGDIAASVYETSRMGWQAAAAELKGTRATLALARRQVEKSDLRAPFAGYVSRRLCEIGTFVSPGMPLFRIVAIDSLRLWLGISQRDLPRVRVGQSVEVTSEAFPNRGFPGRVRSIAPEADKVSRTFPIEVVLPNPAGGPLRDGLVVGATLLLQQLPDVIALPREALMARVSGNHVFVVQDSLALVREVVAGAMIGDRTVIAAGLRPGEAVVISGMQNLRDSTRVSIEIVGDRRTPDAGQEVR